METTWYHLETTWTTRRHHNLETFGIPELGQLWDTFWDNFGTLSGTTLRQLLRQLWDSFETKLGQLWDNHGCIFRLTCSHPELTKDHVLTSAYVKIFRTVTINAVNKSFWRKKDCSWLPLNKHAMNISLSSLRIRAHLSWRTGKHLHVLHVLRTYSTCSYPRY